MRGKNVVITGAGSGLGASLARKYSDKGAHVVLLGRNMEKLIRVSESLPGPFSLHSLDVTNRKRVEQVFETIEQKTGPIHILINNAGTGTFDLLENLEEQAIHEMIDINLKGTIFCTQEALKFMRGRNEGTIINIISKSGKRGSLKESVYCASKFGVSGFMEALALELENTAIRITGFYMGNMATDLWGNQIPEEFGRFIHPDDMADIVIENTAIRKNLMVEQVIVKNRKEEGEVQ